MLNAYLFYRIGFSYYCYSNELFLLLLNDTNSVISCYVVYNEEYCKQFPLNEITRLTSEFLVSNNHLRIWLTSNFIIQCLLAQSILS